jgi:hypothetical protein
MLEKYFIIDKDYKNPLLLQVAEQDFCVKINKITYMYNKNNTKIVELKDGSHLLNISKE